MRPGLEVKQVNSTALGPSLELREFEIIRSSHQDKVHKVKQLHYIGWPDHGVPTGASMEDFATLLDHFITMLINS